MKARHPLQLALGFTVWSVWLVIAYGGLSIGCAVAPPAPEEGAGTWINALLAVLTLATTLALLACVRWCWQASQATGPAAPHGSGRFIAPVAAGLHLAAAAATLFVGLPLAVMPPCV